MHHAEQTSAYRPGLGEIMSQISNRHAKLWFAGQEENWALAAYELDELQEGIEDAARFHPTHKEIKTPLSKLLPQYLDTPVTQLHNAIAAKNKHAFDRQYQQLTAACNACHQATDFGFNQVQQPQHHWFSNQSFKP